MTWASNQIFNGKNAQQAQLMSKNEYQARFF